MDMNILNEEFTKVLNEISDDIEAEDPFNYALSKIEHAQDYLLASKRETNKEELLKDCSSYLKAALDTINDLYRKAKSNKI